MGAILYHKIQEGSNEPDGSGNEWSKHPIQDKENLSGGGDEKFFTICLIYDPDKVSSFKLK
jgi:hypothetical protein